MEVPFPNHERNDSPSHVIFQLVDLAVYYAALGGFLHSSEPMFMTVSRSKKEHTASAFGEPPLCRKTDHPQNLVMLIRPQAPKL